MKTILVVEDDTEVRVLLVRVLRDAGYQTLAAEDGTMALRVARNQHPDMILLDLTFQQGTDNLSWIVSPIALSCAGLPW